MASESNQAPPAFRFAPGYAECIANASNSWAWVELEVHVMIWKLSGLNPTVGACLTAQMFTFDAKLNCLLALLKLREAPIAFISKVNTFLQKSRGALDARNRFVHDVWVNDMQEPTAMGRVKIAARQKLNFATESFSLDALKPELDMIDRSRTTATALRKELEGFLPSLPKIPAEAPHPLDGIR
jgi:hypothetical protein